jgi:hypothetical protein
VVARRIAGAGVVVMRIAMVKLKLRRDRMTKEELQKTIAGAVGAVVGFFCGAGLMTLVGIIF